MSGEFDEIDPEVEAVTGNSGIDDGAARTEVKRARSWRYATLVISTVAVLGSVGLILATAGGPGSSDSAAAAIVTHAATNTSSATSALVHYKMAISSSHNGKSLLIRATGSGPLDIARQRVRMNLTMTIQTSANIHKTISFDEIVADGSIYASGTGFAGQTGGKHWVKIPTPYGSTQSLSSGGIQSPDGILAVLRARGGQVTSVGASNVDGVACQRYRVVVQRSVLESRLGQMHLSPSVLLQVKNMFSSMTSITYVVDVAPDQSMRQMSFSVPFTTSGVTFNMSISMSFSNFGEPVSIVPPAASDVYVPSSPAT